MSDKIEYKGYTINIDQDDIPESPRDWDNLGTMVCFHRRYDLGDKHNFSVEDIKEYVNNPDVISLPLYLYDHSGVWMSTNRNYPFNDYWDAGQVGYIYVDKSTIRKEYKVKHITKSTLNKVINCLVSEVDTYSKYISGEVYGYYSMNPEGEVIGSCCGFYDTDDMIAEAKQEIDADIEQREAERAETTLVEVGC